MLNWRNLNSQLSSMDEDTVLELLDEELNGRKSLRILQRLHQRACYLRTTRERIHLLAEALVP